jgi:hypothetical protein
MRRVLYAGVIFAAVAASATAAFPLRPNQGLTGTWVGIWQDSERHSGTDRLEAVEYPGGDISAVWGGDMYIRGRRTGRDNYFWEHRQTDSTVQVHARLVGDRVLILRYTATFHDGGFPQQVTGQSQLTRAF